MKTKLLAAAVALIVLSAFAKIILYTDKPNAVPVNSDFFSLQRNSDYINASVGQVKGDWFNNPVFTGNGSISGNFTAVNFFGNGSNLSGITASFGPVITNNTFINTNVAFINLETNNIFVNTNVTILSGSSNYINNVFETNVTIVVPGSATNLNLTPNSLMQSDSGDAETSVANGSGVLTNNGAGVFGWVALSGLGGNFVLANNGNGTNTTNWGVTSYQDIQAANAELTNLFTGLTNYAILGTDGNGLLVLGSATNVFNVTTIYASTNFSTNLYSTTAYTTNLFFVTGKGNTLIVTNVAVYSTLTNFGVAASSIMSTDAKQVETNATIGSGLSFSANVLALSVQPTNEVTRQINSGTNIYTPLGAALSGLESGTNLSYIIGTNNGGGNAIVTGAPGTGLVCILTNITADTTLKAFTFWTAGLSVVPVYASCSGGANKQLKFPPNFQGAGDLYGVDLNGTGDTITNNEAKWFEVRCIYGVKTNVFHSATK